MHIVLESFESLLLVMEDPLHVERKVTQQRKKEVPVRDDEGADEIIERRYTWEKKL